MRRRPRHGACLFPQGSIRKRSAYATPPHRLRAAATIRAGPPGGPRSGSVEVRRHGGGRQDGGATGARRGAAGEARGPEQPAARTTKDWQLSLHLVEERDTTRVHAVLDAGGAVLHSDAYARRNPLDDPAPAVGDEFAVGRALIDLGHQLLRAGTRHATGPGEE
ncbi:DUF1876 domain-containing protein [Kitasatospora purpeofusca]|uniref:dsRBD fold-containing protein n=1 Tax=Kitasatospora purpeofusca TaxID=67352 RepID=UPI002E115DA4|nr:DUF1876 domain-containing protein [Kitasatospora purpeofusca]